MHVDHTGEQVAVLQWTVCWFLRKPQVKDLAKTFHNKQDRKMLLCYLGLFILICSKLLSSIKNRKSVFTESLNFLDAEFYISGC